MQKSGVAAVLNFLQPPQTRRMAPGKQRKWWEERKSRLEEGTILCLVAPPSLIGDQGADVLFFVVQKKDVSPNGLATGHAYGSITVRSIGMDNRRDIEALVSYFTGSQSPNMAIVAFPSVIAATFLPILKHLQSMISTASLPLSQLIAPSAGSTPTTDVTQLPPPVYARPTWFSYDLKPICKNGMHLSPRSNASDQSIINKIESETTLDEGQAKALLSALTQELALIQGPPGTGKSYLGVQLLQVLVHNSEEASLGPIIVVCYTNHALDQFLEHLLDAGITKIIRMGSRSMSECMQGRDLNTVSRTIDKTQTERWDIAGAKREIESLSKDMATVLRNFDNSNTKN